LIKLLKEIEFNMGFLSLIQILAFLSPENKKYLTEFDSSGLIWYKFIRSSKGEAGEGLETLNERRQ